MGDIHQMAVRSLDEARDIINMLRTGDPVSPVRIADLFYFINLYKEQVTKEEKC